MPRRDFGSGKLPPSPVFEPVVAVDIDALVRSQRRGTIDNTSDNEDSSLIVTGIGQLPAYSCHFYANTLARYDISRYINP